MAAPWSPRLVAALQRGGADDTQLRTILTGFAPRDYLAASDMALQAAGCERIEPVDGPEPDLSMVTCADERWPKWADSVDSPPAVLWFRGQLPEQRCGVAVVGATAAPGSYERVITAAFAGAAAAKAPLWVDLSDGPTARAAGAVGATVIHVGGRPAVGETGVSVTTSIGEAAGAATAVKLGVSAAAVVCVVGGRIRSPEGQLVVDAMLAGAAVVVPVMPAGSGDGDLVAALGSTRATNLGVRLPPGKGTPNVLRHVPLANAVCRNAVELTEAVRVLCLFADCEPTAQAGCRSGQEPDVPGHG